MTVELIHKHLLATLSSVEAALDRAGAIRRLHHHARQGYAAGPINPSMFTIMPMVLIKIARRNICSIPTQ
jgi:hypothetical protein